MYSVIGKILDSKEVFPGVNIHYLKSNRDFNLKCNVSFMERHSKDDITYKLYKDNISCAESKNFQNYITIVEAQPGKYKLDNYMFNPDNVDEYLEVEDRSYEDDNSRSEITTILDDVNSKCNYGKNAVAVNGVFFDEVTYEPLGENGATYVNYFNIKEYAERYGVSESLSERDSWITSIQCGHISNKYVPFDEKYSKYTGYFSVNYNGVPSISKDSNALDTPYMQSAPILVKDGDIYFTEKDCRHSMFLYKERDAKDQTRILDHACNFNPRTAVGIKKDGTLLFVMVEGRCNRSVGMDLTMLACLMKRLGCIDAINFDGGKSSNVFYNLGRGFRQVRKNTEELTTFERVSDFLPNILMLSPKLF